MAGAAMGGFVSAGASLMSAVMGQSEAKKQRSFIREMENTRYQRTMKDMKLAGLNPLLAYKQGAGSTSPGGIAQVPDLGAAFSKGVGAAASAADVEQKRDLRLTQEDLMRYQADQASATAGNQKAQMEYHRSKTQENVLQRQYLMNDLHRSSAIAAYDRSPAGQNLITLRRKTELGGGAVGNVLGPIGSLLRMGR